MKNFKKRALSMFLAFMLCASLIPVSAFAVDEEGNGGEATEGSKVTVTVSPSEAPVPSDAKEETKTETSTDPDNGSVTETTTTDKTWESTETADGAYGDKEDVSENTDQSEIVDKLTGENPDLDSIADGTYTKTEEQGKTDVVTKVEGEDHRSDSTTTDANGNKVGDSFEVNGQQTTTTTTTDSTKTTTTEVSKETTENVKDFVDEEVVQLGGTDDKKSSSTEGDVTSSNTPNNELDKVEVKFGDDVFDDTDNKVGELTVSGSIENASGTATTTHVNTDAVTRDLLKALDGWTVEVDGKKATVKVDQDTVSYVDEDGKPVEGFKVTLVPGENGSYSIQATKTTTTTIMGKETDASSDKGDTEKGSSSTVVWDETGYELVETVTNKDGSVTQKYVKTGTADRVDTNTWTEVTTRVDGVKEITQCANVNATLTNGEYTVNAKWNGITDNSADNDVVVQVFGPSGTVIGYALTSRKNVSNSPSHHLIIAGALKDETADSLAAQGSIGTANLKFEGLVLQSTVLINDAANQGNASKVLSASPWLRRMSDGEGNYFYVYCAQHGTPDKEGTDYDIVNVDEAGYTYSENANHIQYVVEHGWWGTDSGAGSLTAVKDLIKEKVTSAQLKGLDEGIALAATQAAIWYYAAGENNKIYDEDTFTTQWSNGNAATKDLSADQKAVAMALFNALIQKDKTDEQMASEVKSTTDFIHADDITSTSVKVVEKVDVSSVEELNKLVSESLKDTDKVVDTSNLTGELYKTNVSVTIAVVPSKLNSDDLMVYVYSGDTLVGSKRVDEDTLKNNDGKVTIENVVLENGANVRFHLDGTQKLTEGAYLFRSDVNCTKSQTMVGYVQGSTASNKVDLDVNMTFKVTETGASSTSSAEVSGQTKEYEETHTITRDKTSTTNVTEKHTSTVTVTTTVTEKENSVDKVTVDEQVWGDKGSNTYPVPTPTPEPEPTPEPTPDPGPGTRPSRDPSPTPTPIPDEDVPLSSIPDFEVPLSGTPEEPTVNIPEEDVPLADLPDVPLPEPDVPLAQMPPEETTIPDPEVPLAGVPGTGEEQSLWSGVALVCGAGLVMLVIGKRREDA